jgi:hypothetical protein
MKGASLLHLVLVGLTLALCVFLPRQGAAVLLVPVGGNALSAIRASERGELRLIGPGRIAGTLVVVPAGEMSVVPFLKSGLIPIAAPAFLCSPRRPPART